MRDVNSADSLLGSKV